MNTDSMPVVVNYACCDWFDWSREGGAFAFTVELLIQGTEFMGDPACVSMSVMMLGHDEHVAPESIQMLICLKKLHKNQTSTSYPGRRNLTLREGDFFIFQTHDV